MFISSFLALATVLVPPLSAGEKDVKQETRVLIMLGPPGAGKGTQATIIRDTLKIPHISTGDLLRENKRQGTELGKKAKEYMDQGQLVPDNLILDMLFARVAQEDCQKGYILDGFPRTLAQAKAYHKRLGNTSKVIAINLDITDKEVIERLTNRVVCPSCSTPYHLVNFPPKEKMTCDSCEAKLVQRADDTEDVVRNRLVVYHKQTEPLISFYSEQKALETVVCNQSKDKTTKEILSIFQQSYY